MKHIKIFEDYSEEELGDLIGDLRGIGHQDLIFNLNSDIFFKSYAEDEKKFAESYKKDGIRIISIDGDLRNNFHAKFDILLSNGDKIQLEIPKYGNDKKLFIKGKGLENKNYYSDFAPNNSNKETYVENLMDLYETLKKS